KDWERVIHVNLLGTAAVVRASIPFLKNSHGTVVTVASTLGIKAVSDATAYCAAKFGVVGFTRALAAETAGEIGVTLLIPGGMHTAFFDGRTEQYKPPADAKLNQPEDVAQTVLFALSQPPGCEVRELVVAGSTESSWP
ncbi:MAG: SDR family oxidoreductase, partial [Aldersonia sp.]|nr:SDR family oxidoreductase [Aldersonia sp.]